MSDIVPQPRPPKDERRALIAARCLNLGDQKLCDEMVPNYTGKRMKIVCFFPNACSTRFQSLSTELVNPGRNPPTQTGDIHNHFPENSKRMGEKSASDTSTDERGI